MTARELLHDTLPSLLNGDAGSGADRLAKWVAEYGPSPDIHPLLRLAIHRPGQPFLYYLKLVNLWKRLGGPMLKPNATRRKLLLLTDTTVDNLAPLLKLFAAAFGVDLEIEIPPFDSVEQIAFSSGPCQHGEPHLTVLSLSEHWLARYLGTAALVPRSAIERTEGMLARILAGLRARGSGHLLVTNFLPRSYAVPAGMVATNDAVGWNNAIARLNIWLVDRQDGRTHVIDLADAVCAAGGRSAIGRVSYFRSKMAFEPAGMVAAAREIASAIVQLAGKSHRAVVTDWDNTLWGGEVAEAGSHGIVCGRDTPDGLAYTKVQEWLRGLSATGVLLAGVSRNDPTVTRVFRENAELVLRDDDFASLRVGFGPKSVAIDEVARDLGFGTEFLVFVDDSLFELAEAVTAHPYLDVLLAGPEPELTLRALSESRFFNAVSLSGADVQRGTAARALKEQREFQAGFTDLESFLGEINIRINVAELTDANLQRVVQMFQKSNQFNLTTRRHGEADLRRMLAAGGTIGVFSYEDTFGPQGVISVVVLAQDDDAVRIESWLMSCRVLNRTVERAVFNWIVERAGGREIVGEYLPTEKNGLVRDLYRSLGFDLVSTDAVGGRQVWRFGRAVNRELPKYHAELRRAA
jgi:FkbH-like protein